ncbi:MAG: alanine dehydrogenase [Myxococcota bacterium]|nr:alanine dehydrogenase [Myxococcota bacterium]
MEIGIPKEIKVREYRVGQSPAGVAALVGAGHRVKVESGAGVGAGFEDSAYKAAGAQIVATADEAWNAEMVIKVKEPIAAEWHRMQEGQLLFTYLHLAADAPLTHELMKKKIQSVAYETVELADRSLPLLRPMSEVAGRLSAQAAARCLEKERGGKGLLMGGVPGTNQANVVVIGGGVVGLAAARICMGMGARVTILERSVDRMIYLDDVFNGRIQTLYSSPLVIDQQIAQSDVVIGAVLVPGAKAPHLVSKDQVVNRMTEGSVIVDVAVDQGGCIETCRPTTHDDPTFIVGDVVHYCVANMPGAVPRTSTVALTNTTLSYALSLAGKGLEQAIRADAALAKGVNIYNGACVYEPVSIACDVPFEPLAIQL